VSSWWTTGRDRAAGAQAWHHTVAGSCQPLESQTRAEEEGTGRRVPGERRPGAVRAVKTGIAGEKYFEVLSGLKADDEVITGPFASVRGLREGDQVRVTAATPTAHRRREVERESFARGQRHMHQF
jgi:hypothetical protein